MLTEEELKRSYQFKKRTQNNAGLGNFLNLEKINEAIQFYKHKLKKTYKTASPQELEKILEKLEKLLSQKTGLILKTKQEQFGKIPENIIKEELENFTASYRKLFLLKKKLLSKYGR